MTKKKTDAETRLAELLEDRAGVCKQLDAARTEAPSAIIEGREPPPTAALAEHLANLDAAIAELRDCIASAEASAERARQRRRVETAIESSRTRSKTAAAVDKALDELRDAWSAYCEEVRTGIGQVSAAGGDTSTMGRVLTSNRAADPLIKALVAAGGTQLARSFGIETNIRARHASPLAEVEERVTRSLEEALLRLRAESPNKHMAEQAEAELEDFLN